MDSFDNIRKKGKLDSRADKICKDQVDPWADVPNGLAFRAYAKQAKAEAQTEALGLAALAGVLSWEAGRWVGKFFFGDV